MRKPTKEIQLTSYDDLLGINGEMQEGQDKIVEIPLQELHTFQHHPFQVREDEELEKIVESIKEYGVLTPILVRTRREGEYEIISGHRRKKACEMAGLEKIPALIREYSDDESTVCMVDSNIQRENILPSEKAYAYKMKMDALRHQGVKGKSGMETADMVGAAAEESGRTVQRYIRLTELTPELLELVDTKKLNITPAEVISYLSQEEQMWVYQCMKERKVTVSVTMAKLLKRYSEEKSLTKLAVELTICKEKKEKETITFKKERVSRYFPEEYSSSQMEAVIYMLLEKWSMHKIQEG